MLFKLLYKGSDPCLNSARVTIQDICAVRILQPLGLPILDDSTGVLTVAYSDHYDEEEEEEASHGKAHSVH